MKNVLITVLALIFIFFPICVQANSATAYVVPAITDNKILPKSSIPSSYISDTISVKASPGEVAPASFVIHADQGNSIISVESTDLTGSNGVIPATAIEIRTVKCWYQGGKDVYSVEPDGGRYLTPELLLKDDSLIKVTGEEWAKWDSSNPNGKDYLKVTNGSYIDISGGTPTNTRIIKTPISACPVSDAASLQPVTLNEGYNKQFWITLKVPNNIKADNYSGSITIKSGSETLQKLKLNLQVLPITLLEPSVEYSVYYRGTLTTTGSISSEEKTATQFTAEMQDMFNHGVKNPTVYYQADDKLKQTLDIRSQIGINNANMYNVWEIPASNIQYYKTLTSPYSVGSIYQYGPDEQSLADSTIRNQINAEHNAGGKHFNAEWEKAPAIQAADILDLLIAGNFWPDVADTYHSYGHKIYLYNAPQTVSEYPRTFRLNYGLMLWQINYDGAMDYAYQDSMGNIWNDFDYSSYRDHVFAYPTMNGVIDTIQWEGFREAVKDMQYLATLQNTIKLAKSQGKDTSAAENYLINLKKSDLSSQDLDAVRGQMINYILSLQNQQNSTSNPGGGQSNFPVATFNADNISGKPPLIVTFTDQSTGTPTAWNWSFGDGTTNSTVKNPVHTYSAVGNYTVALTVSNTAGSNTTTKSNYIKVTASTPKPIASFSSNVTSGNTPLIVTFTDQSTGTPTAWNWNFGDGTTNSTVKNPVHTYSAAGSYTVTLTASNTAGSGTISKNNYINVNVAALQKPTADFRGYPRTGYRPLTVTFTDNSTGAPTAWNWSFGDGTFSTAKNPVHIYNNTGVYNVSLTATNANGSNIKQISNYVTVRNRYSYR